MSPFSRLAGSLTAMVLVATVLLFGTLRADDPPEEQTQNKSNSESDSNAPETSSALASPQETSEADPNAELTEDEGTTQADPRTRIESLSAEELEQLRRNQERFEKMPPPEQQRIRELHAKLQKHEQAEHLQGVMKRYSSWLRSLPAGQRAELLSLSGRERVKKIEELMRRQEQERFLRLAADQLTPADHTALLKWVRSLAISRRETLIAEIPQRYRDDFERGSKLRQEGMLTFTLLRNPQDLKVTPDEFQGLLESLSDAAKKTLENAGAMDKKTRLVREWVRFAAISQMRFRQPREPVPQEKLTEFYQSLDHRQREYLNSLPSDRMKRELETMYHSRSWAGRRPRPPFGGSGFKGRPSMDGRSRDGGGRRAGSPRRDEDEKQHDDECQFP